MSKKALLTLAIPAYNRVDTLEILLKQILAQNCVEIEILIIDDNSPDEGRIENMVRFYQLTVPNLKFKKNAENLGFSGNVLSLYDLAETRYVWFICDDDLLLPNSIQTVITSLKKYEPVVTIFNFLQKDPYDFGIQSGVRQDTIYEKLEDLHGDYQPIMRLNFLSSIVVEKRISVDKFTSKNYRGNVFFQITLGLLLLSDKMKLVEIASPILERIVGFKYGDFYKFYLVDHLKAVYLLPHKFDNRDFIKWSKKHLLITAFKLYFSQKLGMYTYKGSPTRETVENLYKYYGSFYASLLLLMRPLYKITPAILVKIIYLVTLIIKRGYKNGIDIYKKQLNRAFRDTRKTDFVTYR